MATHVVILVMSEVCIKPEVSVTKTLFTVQEHLKWCASPYSHHYILLAIINYYRITTELWKDSGYIDETHKNVNEQLNYILNELIPR